MTKESIKLKVNGRWYEFRIGKNIEPSDSLSFILREKLGLTGVRVSCGQGACGACTVLLNGKSVLSCMMLAVEADEGEILTIEGLDGSDLVVQAFVDTCEPGYGTAMQCGFCTPGFVLETHALLERIPKPSGEEIKEALAGHICRCGCYHGIRRAVEKAVESVGNTGKETL